jgi:hypothetical protein
MYPATDNMERQQVEWVHGLTGGELSDRPLRILDTTGRGRFWARYWYDGAPEWSDEHAYASGRKGWRGSWRTLVWDSGAYGDFQPPATFRDSSGRRWRKLNSYSSSGEAPCPVPENHPGRVTRKDAKLSEKWNGPGARPSWYKRRARCPMCDERIGSEHGFLYLGEGWIEAVYYSPDRD